jgi:hypothetical protein
MMRLARSFYIWRIPCFYLALAQDNAFGQPLEAQLRSCLLATWICEAAGFEREVRAKGL